MAATTTAEVADSVVAAHLQTEFLLAAAAQERWDQFTWVPQNGVISPAQSETATSQQIVIYYPLDLITSTIPEATDIEGVQIGDTSISVSVGEYGNAAQDTKRLRALARTDIPEAIQELMGRNAGLSQDVWARSPYLGGSIVRRPVAATRATLSTVSDDLQAAGFNFMYSLAAQLRSVSAPGIATKSEVAGRAQGGAEPGAVDYASVVHDLLTGDMLELGGFTPIQYITAPEARQQLYNGEFGRIAGIRLVESPLGKVYQSAGTTAQAATSLATATVVGATSVMVATATGITTGDYITIGTVETANTESTDLETALVASITDTTTMVVVGAGAAGGLRYAHAAAAGVTEAVFVAAIPIFGGMSVAKSYSSICGPKPTIIKSGPFDKLARFQNYGWWWLGGYARTIPAWLVRGEIAVNGKCIMAYGG